MSEYRDKLRSAIRKRLPVDLRTVEEADSFADWVASLCIQLVLSDKKEMVKALEDSMRGAVTTYTDVFDSATYVDYDKVVDRFLEGMGWKEEE